MSTGERGIRPFEQAWLKNAFAQIAFSLEIWGRIILPSICSESISALILISFQPAPYFSYWSARGSLVNFWIHTL